MALTKILEEGIKDGEIVNADINASAAIATSKITGLATSATTDTTNASNIGSGSLANARLTKPIDFADNEQARFGTGNDLQIYHSGSHSFIHQDGTGNLYLLADTFRLNNETNSENIIATNANADVQLYYDNSKKLETTSAGVSVTGTFTTSSTINSGGHVKTGADFSGFYSGASDDLFIYHSGSHSFIDNNTGDLNIESSNIHLKANNTETAVSCLANGAVELYHNNSKKLETTSSGVLISGHLDLDDGNAVKLGSGDDLQIYHNGSHSYISNVGTGELVIEAKSGENGAVFRTDGAAELYWDGTKKFETTSGGATVTGSLGIGTTSPTTPFQVLADATGYGGMDTTGVFSDSRQANSSVGGGVTFTGKYNNAGSQVGFGSVRGIKENGTDSNYAGTLTFNTRPNGANMTERMRIDSSGRLLIGTTTEGFGTADDLTIASSADTGITIRSGTTNQGNIFFSDATSGTGEFSGIIQYTHGSGTGEHLRLFVNAAEKVRIDSDGLKLNGDTAAANALDDYEEGTWTPTTANSGGGFANVISATYTKIGRLVNVSMYANFNSSQPNSNQVRIGGLPFQSTGSVYHFAVGRLQGFGGADIVWQVGGTSDYFTPYYNNSIPTYNQVGGYYVLISATYHTS